MQYACLVYVDADAVAALTKEEGRALIDGSMEFDADLKRRGHLIMAQPLEEPETAVTIRVRSGRMSATDGPFAETKEHLGGFFLIEARDLAEAIQLAAKSPMATVGSIEVRPFDNLIHGQAGATGP